ncbi:signal peptidase II [Paenibacillus sp. 19GGS1-52]|uniref:signal peptidase II n=1 Tax=Paenibacillus sp. 19GGS1-52 TaxID=2758563 RepID=UPI001EFB68E0|nr:signal peptidase II [Paenibacillus sp. 19GGS1-52]ULO09458.1 signal peptidase II [Paenibacillus sp. 19GGS1-52]
MLIFVISAMVILMDQGSKWIVRSNMQVGETVPVWNHILQFTHFENSGAAFSSFQGYGKYFVIIALVFVAGLIYYRRKGEIKGVLMETAAGFLAGGAIGNAIDRLVFHKVTDFLVFGKSNGILNLANVAINVGVILFVIHLLKGQLKLKLKPKS